MANNANETASDDFRATLIPFEAWLKWMGLTRTTGYRYRQKDLIKVVNIYGRLYVTADEIRRFESRAMNGEFLKKSCAPWGSKIKGGADQ